MEFSVCYACNKDMGSNLSMIKEPKLQKEKENKIGKKEIIFVGKKCNLIFKKKIFYGHIRESLIVSLIQKKNCIVFGADI